MGKNGPFSKIYLNEKIESFSFDESDKKIAFCQVTRKKKFGMNMKWALNSNEGAGAKWTTLKKAS